MNLNNRKPNVKIFHVFGSMYFLFNSKEHRNKFHTKADEEIFLGYSLNSKAYRVLNKKKKKIEESYYVTFDNKYIKLYQVKPNLVEENFPSSISKTIPIMSLYEDFVNFFDEYELTISS